MAQKKKSVKPVAATAPPPIQCNEVHLSSCYFRPALALLQNRNTPVIPAAFLLDDVDFKKEYANVLSGSAADLQPCRDEFGRRFWNRSTDSHDPEDLRRALVPIAHDLAPIVDSLTLPDGTVSAKAFLYPWGAGLLIDVVLRGPLTLAAAVDRLVDLHEHGNIAWKMGSDSGAASPAVLASQIYKRLAPQLYGGVAQKGVAKEFSIATVTDGSGIDPATAIVADGLLHRALEGLTAWNRLWQTTPVPSGSLASCAIPTKGAPLGHILYGRGRARAIWFPSSFSSVKGAPMLSCFHQNLSAASLHTDALCFLARDAAAQLTAHGNLDNFSVTYRNCAQLAAGLLGRLHGKKPGYTGAKPDIYRSGSIRSQILDYKDDVNQLRGFYPTMPPLDT